MRKFRIAFFALILISSALYCTKSKDEEKQTKMIAVSGDLSFGVIDVNTTASRTVTIKNTGTGPVDISSITLPQGFSVDWPGGTIEAGSSKKVNVQFAPKQARSYTGEMIIKSEASTTFNKIQVSGEGKGEAVLSISPASLSYGDVAVDSFATRILIISNTGNLPLTINSITAADMAFTVLFIPTIAANSSQEISVKFSPLAVRPYTGTLSVSTNGGDASISLSGAGIPVPAPVLKVSPSSLSFGNIAVGSFNTKTFTVSNTGNAPLMINSITTPNAVFALNFGTTVAANSSQEIVVKFSPAAIQSYSGSLSISTNGGNANISLEGAGIAAPAPVLKVSPSSLSFGNIAVGSFNTKTFTVSNTGNAPLMINSITTPNAVFALNFGTTVAANSSQEIVVKFSPTAIQSYSGSLSISTNGGNANISLEGAGIAAPVPVLSISPLSLNFGAVTVGVYTTLEFTISNTGNAPLTITGFTTSDNSLFSISNYPVTTPAGGSQKVTAIFMPKAAQSYSGYYIIYTNGGSATITLSGTGVTGNNKIALLNSADDPDSRLVEYVVPASQYQGLINSSTFQMEIQLITKLIYEKVNDDFDFIFYVLDKPESSGVVNQLGFYGINISITNNVQGIGKGIYSNSSSWGSAGKLKSVMFFPIYDAIHRGPALHELCHNWAAYLCPTYAPDGSRYDGHWGVSNADGQLGGFKYVRTVEQNSGGVAGKTKYQASFSPATNPDGSFTSGFGVNANGGNYPVYSDIELYAMGMKSAQDLRNSNFRLNIYTGCSYDNTFGAGYFWSTGITSYTIDDLIAAKGQRVPDASSSQKNFKVLTVVLTAESETVHHYTDIVKGISWLSGAANDNSYPGWAISNFRKATGGVGSLLTTGVKNSWKTPTQSVVKKVSLRSSPIPAKTIQVDKIDKKLLYNFRH
ncbi:choice-of-anchor D domain-containing protein [Niabella drilacis]|uniref:Abnormal spindle-like microcephaly-assoc'd, ASPM-SPD-2-Hydin n=1 Tax=Niabella drilacis (strain DSM 25811 / CCM 8410 / CCUG 62505 / LMG 26954 / E90) TaxID=1285928 RepID=A0A1G6S0N4_NIADE|nr:choice-of-anchor D domain-containing protein [Niabella drilacis]SDD10231.1 Abnormal spindle-like microcephaly-assoc'd, ASPM-SPD-2-Hydin [Niabella drilacis]